MTTLIVPPPDAEPWPTLGPQIVAHIEHCLVYGPGDLRGEPAKVSNELRAIIYRAYEVFPDDHPEAGRRRFNRVALSLPKGWAKSEVAAWIGACELDEMGPVRTLVEGGRAIFDGQGNPVGVGVRDPYIPFVATSEEQADELTYGALMSILQDSTIADRFNIGLERITRIDGTGRAVSVAGSPNARDGARTTFEHFDEPHRYVLPSMKRAHRTMLANLPKRKAANAWALETSTTYMPGEGSVLEATHDYARAIDRGEVSEPTLFFLHRQASEEWDVDDPEQREAAIREARGPEVSAWSDIRAIAAQWDEPDADRSYLARVWLNQPVQGASQAFSRRAWDANARPEQGIPEAGALIALGFDGSRSVDATGLIGTDLVTGWQWKVAGWERPLTAPGNWKVPVDEADAAVAEAFATWTVARFYADPRWWETWVDAWAGLYGRDIVAEWQTNAVRRMALACRAFGTAITEGEIPHSGDEDYARHIGNARKREERGHRADDGEPLWTISKDRPDSIFKIDYAMAGILSWEARNDAIAAGALIRPEPKPFAQAFRFDKEPAA